LKKKYTLILKINIHIQALNIHNNHELESIHSMIMSFYEGYETDIPMSPAKIQTTLLQLQKHPETGTALLILKEKEIIGYSILINFWSNEYGGNILFIDELFIKEEHRNGGIGTVFFKLVEEKFIEAKILALELSPANTKAANLYKKLGFRKNKNATLFKIL